MYNFLWSDKDSYFCFKLQIPACLLSAVEQRAEFRLVHLPVSTSVCTQSVLGSQFHTLRLMCSSSPWDRPFSLTNWQIELGVLPHKNVYESPLESKNLLTSFHSQALLGPRATKKGLVADPIKLFFLRFFFFCVKLGHFKKYKFWLYVTNMQAYQQKTEKNFR